jgi:hypothetical protein
MKQSILLLLILATTVYGQNRSLRTDLTLPAPVSGSGTVTLPLAEYNRLAELAARKPKISEAPPLPFVLSRARFNLRMENQALTGTLQIEGTVLEKGAVKIPLSSGLTILEARQTGNSLPLLHEASTYAAVLNGPGPFAITLTVASALTVEAGRASFVVPVVSASSSLLSLDIPGNHANVRVEPGLVTSRTTTNGHTIVDATLEPGKPSRIWWTTREIAAPLAQRDVRFLSDIKTVVTVGDSELSIAALCDLTVIQGDATEFRVPLPSGFELKEVSGTTLEASEEQAGILVLKVREPGRRNHQFLIAIERTNQDTKAAVPLLAFSGAQRETGELLIEGIGAMELTPTESGGLRRMDVREAGAVARSLARFPLQAAFRYNRRPGDTPSLQLDWTRFPDSRVLSAVAERATITTLTNVEGKALTEVTLRVRNHAQPFVKVELPAGATLLSAEVEGERVKPVFGDDGNRVPLLRAGFSPSGVYTVSFVYLSSGARFGKSGAYEMGLPKLDVPINLMTWEISLPDRLEVKRFGGNALAAELFPAVDQNFVVDGVGYDESESGAFGSNVDLVNLQPGAIGGIVVDPQGAVVPGVAITVTNTQTGATLSTVADDEGRWMIAGMQPGPVRVSVNGGGFKTMQQEFALDGSRATRLGTTLEVAGATEAVTVTGDTAINGREYRRIEEERRKSQMAQINTTSQNVVNLQRRVAGILPVRMEVPRAGKSYRFVRPLVLEEETKVSFEYKSK